MKFRSWVAASLAAAVCLFFLAGQARADDAAGGAAAGAGLQQGDYVALLGDSITQQDIYSVFIEDYLLMCKPGENLSATNFGWNGEMAPQFEARMETDMVPLGCTVATSCYGMNDGGYSPMDAAKGKRYLDAQTAIITKLKAAHVRFIVLGSPGCVDATTYKNDPKMSEMYNKTLSALHDIDKKVAEDQGVAFAEVFEPMTQVMAKAKAKYGDKYEFAGHDGIHPNRSGHLVMAYAFLKALGCKGDIGTITVDLGAGTAQATDGHKIVSVKNGAVTVESSRYPFCFHLGRPEDPAATIGVLEFIPFNDDLNRFKLVVNNAPSDKLKVTWGTASKEFSAADLKAGINLAAEFPDNPFSDPFNTMEQMIFKKQRREIDLTQLRLHNLAGYESWLPDQKDLIQNMQNGLVKAEKAACQEASAAVKPVTHTITIEAVK